MNTRYINQDDTSGRKTRISGKTRTGIRTVFLKSENTNVNSQFSGYKKQLTSKSKGLPNNQDVRSVLQYNHPFEHMKEKFDNEDTNKIRGGSQLTSFENNN